MEVLIFVLGACGIVLNLLIYQQKTGRRVLIFKLLSDILWAAHYFFLGAYSGFAIACIGIVRETVFIKVNKKSRAGVVWLIIFAVASVASTALTWKSAASLLPGVASLLSVFGFFLAIPSLSRYLAFPISICMGAYDIYAGSSIGIVNEVLTLISATIGVIRLHRKTDKKENTEEA